MSELVFLFFWEFSHLWILHLLLQLSWMGVRVRARKRGRGHPPVKQRRDNATMEPTGRHLKGINRRCTHSVFCVLSALLLTQLIPYFFLLTFTNTHISLMLILALILKPTLNQNLTSGETLSLSRSLHNVPTTIVFFQPLSPPV